MFGLGCVGAVSGGAGSECPVVLIEHRCLARGDETMPGHSDAKMHCSHHVVGHLDLDDFADQRDGHRVAGRPEPDTRAAPTSRLTNTLRTTTARTPCRAATAGSSGDICGGLINEYRPAA